MQDKEISVFVDESGSFDPDAASSRYYLLCLVFHDQAHDLYSGIATLENSLADLGLDKEHCIHAGPLIRREREYGSMSREERRAIISRMMSFIRRAPVEYACFALDKKFMSGASAIHDVLLQSIVRCLIDHADCLNQCDCIKVYYDNGQAQVKTILKQSFAIYSSKTVYVDDVHPAEYRLFQVADTLCTLELTRAKLDAGDRLSASEFEFFGGIQNLRKQYLKPISRKRL